MEKSNILYAGNQIKYKYMSGEFTIHLENGEKVNTTVSLIDSNGIPILIVLKDEKNKKHYILDGNGVLYDCEDKYHD